MPWYHAFGFTQLGFSLDFQTDIKFLSHFDPAIFLQTIQQHRVSATLNFTFLKS